MPFLEQPLPDKQPHPKRKRRGRPKKNGQLLVLSNDESPTTPIQLQPVEPCGRDEQLQSNQDRREEELTVLPQEQAKGSEGRVTKRGAESEEERKDEASVAKRVCFEQMIQPTPPETCLPSSEAAAVETEDVIDVEAVSLTSVGDEKTTWTEIKLGETDQNGEERRCLTDEEIESSDEIIDVDGDSDGSTNLKREDNWREWAENIRCQNSTAPALLQLVKVKPSASPPSLSLKEVSLRSTGSWEEDRDGDIDVIGGSSPLPDPVIISWTESSGGEEQEGGEEIDVTGENKDYTSSAAFTMSKGELVNRKYHPEVLLH